jgi:hypothetical protein
MVDKALEGKSEKEIRDKEDELRVHYVAWDGFDGITIALNRKGTKSRAAFAMLGVSSKEKIGVALKALEKSPFKTVFVVNEETGHPVFALSKNEEFVAKAKRCKKKPPPPPPPPRPTNCCAICGFTGGESCVDFGDGSCYCIYGDGGPRGSGNLDDPLETIPSPGL